MSRKVKIILNPMADMGNVMKILMPKIQGRADGGQASQLVRQKLQQ